MEMDVLSNNAEQPESHSCPIERRDPEARCGKMCAFRAVSGRPGISSTAVCVDFIVALFESIMFILFCVGTMSVKGTVV